MGGHIALVSHVSFML